MKKILDLYRWVDERYAWTVVRGMFKGGTKKEIIKLLVEYIQEFEYIKNKEEYRKVKDKFYETFVKHIETGTRSSKRVPSYTQVSKIIDMQLEGLLGRNYLSSTKKRIIKECMDCPLDTYILATVWKLCGEYGIPISSSLPKVYDSEKISLLSINRLEYLEIQKLIILLIQKIDNTHIKYPIEFDEVMWYATRYGPFSLRNDLKKGLSIYELKCSISELYVNQKIFLNQQELKKIRIKGL